MGLRKPLVFGFIVATIGCYYGLSTKGGTQGVGRATTEAVVAAMILIIAVDVFVTRFLMVVLGSCAHVDSFPAPCDSGQSNPGRITRRHRVRRCRHGI